MKQKKKHSTRTLVLSIVCLVIGVIFLAVLVIMANAGNKLNPGGAAGDAVIGAMFLILGIVELLRWRRMAASDPSKKPGRVVGIILAVVAVLFLVQAGISLPPMWRNMRMNGALRAYVQDSYAATEAALPEDPWFVFYHNGSFSVPSSAYARGTDDPDKVNVVVAYTESVSTNGTWVEQGTNETVADARVQNVTLNVIRLEDWALIDTASFSEQLDYDETGVNVLGMNQVRSYLGDLFDEKS